MLKFLPSCSLRDWLATVPYVERVSDAEKGDGGTGCSVIWVK